MNTFFHFIFFYLTAILQPITRLGPSNFQRGQGHRVVNNDSLPGRTAPDFEYVDTVYLGLNKNSYVEVKGVEPLSADVGGDKQNILIAVQENSSIVKLKALRKGFADANMIVVCKDTVLQYLIRYTDNPPKNYYSYEITVIRQKIIQERTARTPLPIPSRQASVTTPIAGQKPNADSAARAVTAAPLPAVDSVMTRAIQHLPVSRPKDSTATLTATPAGLPSASGAILNRLRSRKINVQIGVVSGGLRATLDRLYMDAHHRVYYAITIENRENTAFKVDYIAFQVFNKFTRYRSPIALNQVGGSDNPTSIPANSARALVFETEPIAMLPEEVLMITLAEPNKEGAREIAIRLTPTDLTRTANWLDD